MRAEMCTIIQRYIKEEAPEPVEGCGNTIEVGTVREGWCPQCADERGLGHTCTGHKAMGDHTPGQLEIDPLHPLTIVIRDVGVVASVAHLAAPRPDCDRTEEEVRELNSQSDANAARIVACVNHFQGIPTEAVENLRPAKDRIADAHELYVSGYKVGVNHREDFVRGLIAEHEEAMAAIQHIDESLEGWIVNEKGLAELMDSELFKQDHESRAQDYANLRSHTQSVISAQGSGDAQLRPPRPAQAEHAPLPDSMQPFDKIAIHQFGEHVYELDRAAFRQFDGLEPDAKRDLVVGYMKQDESFSCSAREYVNGVQEARES